MRNAYIILEENLKGRKYFGDLVVEERMVLKFM
jgi:hypothetical protein